MSREKLFPRRWAGFIASAHEVFPVAIDDAFKVSNILPVFFGDGIQVGDLRILNFLLALGFGFASVLRAVGMRLDLFRGVPTRASLAFCAPSIR